MNRSESVGKIAAALLQAQASMGNAVKGAANPYFKSKFADLNSIREAVTPALNSNGITVLQPTTTVDGKAYVETVLLHESGEFLSSLTEIVTAKVNDPQAAGSGISYARRYGLQSFLSVGAEDDDGESAMGRDRNVPKSVATPPVVAVVAKQTTEAPVVVAQATVEPKVAAPAAVPTSVRKTGFNKPGAVKAALVVEAQATESEWT